MKKNNKITANEQDMNKSTPKSTPKSTTISKTKSIPQLIAELGLCIMILEKRLENIEKHLTNIENIEKMKAGIE